jgi:hypothetical protein
MQLLHRGAKPATRRFPALKFWVLRVVAQAAREAARRAWSVIHRGVPLPAEPDRWQEAVITRPGDKPALGCKESR